MNGFSELKTTIDIIAFLTLINTMISVWNYRKSKQ